VDELFQQDGAVVIGSHGGEYPNSVRVVF